MTYDDAYKTVFALYLVQGERGDYPCKLVPSHTMRAWARAAESPGEYEVVLLCGTCGHMERELPQDDVLFGLRLVHHYAARLGITVPEFELPRNGNVIGFNAYKRRQR